MGKLSEFSKKSEFEPNSNKFLNFEIFVSFQSSHAVDVGCRQRRDQFGPTSAGRQAKVAPTVRLEVRGRAQEIMYIQCCGELGIK